MMTVLIAATACTSPPAPTDIAPTPTAVAASSTPPPMPVLRGERGATGDVVLRRCDLQSGDVVATGTIRNSADHTADFALTVQWRRNSSADWVGAASTTIRALKAGGKATWTITTTLGVWPDRCSVNARSGTLA